MANVAQVRAGGKLAQRKLLLRKHRGAVRGRDERPPGRVSRSRAWAARSRPATWTTTAISICSSPTTATGANLLLNDGGNAANAMLVQAVGTKSNRSGIGTRLTLTAGGRRQVREVQSGSSYLAQNDLRAHFGLGRAGAAERLEIRWPDGSNEVVENLPANQIVTIRQGKGIVSRAPLAR